MITTKSVAKTPPRLIIIRPTTRTTSKFTTKAAEVDLSDVEPAYACDFQAIAPPKTARDDLHKYTGSAVICYVIDKKNFDCDICKDFCLSKNYVCPTECQCHWLE